MPSDTTPSTRSNHTWKFFRVGGFDQVRLDTGADLLALDQLDQKLWVALSCPTKGLEFDAKTLELLDTDKDGRIRVPEIIAAVKWATGLLKNADDLTQASPALPLAAINDATDEGRRLLASARQILTHLGKADAVALTLDDTTDTARIFSQTRFNGDGIVPVEAAEDEATKTLLGNIITCLGAENDRSGKPGISQAKADQFFAAAQAFADWSRRAEEESTLLLPLGAATANAAAAVKAVRAKVDDYFTRCRLVAFDARASASLNRAETDYTALAAKDLSAAAQETAGFPLARIEAGRALPLRDGVNPAWSAALATLHTDAVKPLLGERTELTAAEWAEVCGRLAPYEGWQAAKAGAVVEPLGLARVREILAGSGKESVTALIARDKALEAEFDAIASVDRLVRYHRDLHKLLNNFVSFRDFYLRRDKAVFQVGTLFLDGRSCDLCVRVDDMGRHGALAGLSRCYLAYCDCTRRGSAEKMTIAAAFTGGDADNLMVGRNGVFYDRQGRDWDATITKISDNPISIRQAFWSPYKKVARFIEETISKRAATADAAATDKLTGAATSTVKAAETGKAPDAKPKLDTGVIAALGVAAAGLGGMIGGVVSGFLSLGALMPLGVLGIMLLISGPSMLLAYMKLRQRNLGPILDANGWAVNARARINLPFGSSLTKVAALPAGAERSLEDPFAEQPSPWPKLLVLAGLLFFLGYCLNQQGKLHEWSGGVIGTEKKPAAGTTAPPAK